MRTPHFLRLAAFAVSLAVTANAETFHGIGKANTRHLIDTVEVILTYDSSSPVTVTTKDESGRLIGVVKGFHAKIAIRFYDSSGPFWEHDLTITQWPDKESSLMGYFLGPSFGVGESRVPMILRVDTWDKEKPFYLYTPAKAADSAYVGKFAEKK